MLNNHIPKTELHTHFIEILNAKEYFDFLMSYSINIPINEFNQIDYEHGKPINIHDIYNDEKLYNSVLKQLSFEKGIISDFNNLGNIIEVRNNLLKSTSQTYEIYNTDPLYALALSTYELLKRTLLCLKKEGIEYTEITYSNTKIITIILNELLKNDPNKVSGITFKFLMGTNRNKSPRNFKKCEKTYQKLLEFDDIIGNDLCGVEMPIKGEEILFYQRRLLSLLTPMKTSLKDGVLRLHSGEFDGFDNAFNTETLLSILEKIEHKNKIDILPTEIRIGHGINIHRKGSLCDLLKKYKVIIELNISSNIILGNVKKEDIDVYKRVLDFYIDSDIETVLSTDGHGIYGTTPKIEYDIAESIIGNRIEYLEECDSKILQRKLQKK